MRTFENSMKVDRLKFTAKTVPYCRLGENYYHADITVEIMLGKKLCDFLDIEDYFKSLNGESLIDEELVAKVFEDFKAVYEPEHMIVTVRTSSHFPLEVSKEM